MDTTQKFVITINRQVGSGGRNIGEILSKRLGVKYYDKTLMEQLTKEEGYSLEQIEQQKTQKGWWASRIGSYLASKDTTAEMLNAVLAAPALNVYQSEANIMRHLADKGSCIIAGRSAAAIFKDTPNCVRVFITSSREKRIARIVKKEGITPEEAAKKMDTIEESRARYTKLYANTDRYDALNYDLVINATSMSDEDAADIIMAFIAKG